MMVKMVQAPGVSLRGVELAGRSVAASARINIWVLEEGKAKFRDPLEFADILIELTSPEEAILDLWEKYESGAVDILAMERELEPLVERMEAQLVEVAQWSRLDGRFGKSPGQDG